MQRVPRIVLTVAMAVVLMLSGFVGMSPTRPVADAQPALGQEVSLPDVNKVEAQVTIRPFPSLGATVVISNKLTLSVNGRTSSSFSLHIDDTISAVASTRFVTNKRLRICTDETCSFVVSQTAVTFATSVSLSISARYAASFASNPYIWVVVDNGNGIARASTIVQVFSTRDFTINDDDYGLGGANAGTPMILRSKTPGQYLPGYFEVFSGLNCTSFSQTWTAYRDVDGSARYDSTIPVDDTTSYRFQAASNGRYSQSNCIEIFRPMPYPGLNLTVNGVAGNRLIRSGSMVTLGVQVNPTFASNVVFHSYTGANCAQYVSSQAGARSGDVYTLVRSNLRAATSYIATATSPGGSRVESLCRTVNVIQTLSASGDIASPSVSVSALPSARPPRLGPVGTTTPLATATPSPSATPTSGTSPVPTGMTPTAAESTPAATQPPPTTGPETRPPRVLLTTLTEPAIQPTRPPRTG